MGADNGARELDVVVIGSALVEITPAEMGRPLAEVETMHPLPSGSAANFAGALAALGARVGLISRVGADELGQWLIDRLAQRGIDTRFIAPVEGQLTPVSFAWMDQDGEKTFFFYRFPEHCDPMATLTSDRIERAQVAGGRIFDFTEATVRNEPLRSAALKAARIAAEAGRTVCYAGNYRPAAWRDQSEHEIIEVQQAACSQAEIVVMNREEASFVSQSDGEEQQLRNIAELGPRIVIVTRGEDGSLVLDGESIEFVPARKVQVVYDIGAGDTFHAGLLAGIVRGMSAVEAARLGSDAAALRISRPAGAADPDFDEVHSLASRPL